MRQITPYESHRQFAKIVAEITKGQATRKQIVAKTGLHRKFVSRVLMALKEQGCVYIIQWDTDKMGRHQQAVFSLGYGEDAPRPSRKTEAMIDAKRYRKKKEKLIAEKSVPIKTQFVGGSLWA